MRKQYDFAQVYFDWLKTKEKPVKEKKEDEAILECGGKTFEKSWVIHEGKPYLSYIAWTELEEKMGKRMYNNFGKWMRGQTCIGEGAYPCDVENFFRPKHRQFWD